MLYGFSAAEPTAGFATTGAFFPVAIASASRKARFSRHEHHSLSSARTRWSFAGSAKGWYDRKRIVASRPLARDSAPGPPGCLKSVRS